MDLHTLTTQFPGGWGLVPCCSQPPIWRNWISYCRPLIPETSILVSWHRFETWWLDSSELFDAHCGSAWGEWREGGRLWDRFALWRPATHTHHGRHQGKKRIGRKVIFFLYLSSLLHSSPRPYFSLSPLLLPRIKVIYSPINSLFTSSKLKLPA